MLLYIFFFFFSSRRRHTRCSRDWSSDVCSSDLHPGGRRRTPYPVCDPRRGHPSPLSRPSSLPPYVTAWSARVAMLIPRRNASFPSSTPNGALYTISTLANGRGRQNRSHDSTHHADERRAPRASRP